MKPNLPPAVSDTDDTDVSVTSLHCQWKPPWKQKQSTLRTADATFEKHDYAKPVRRKMKQVEGFDPKPPEFRGLL